MYAILLGLVAGAAWAVGSGKLDEILNKFI